MRPRVLLVVAGGLAAAIASYAVLAPSGLPQLWKLRDQETSLHKDVDTARAENARLADEVKVLQGGEPASKAVLEKHAREELGYVKNDEVVFTVPSSSPAPAQAVRP